MDPFLIKLGGERDTPATPPIQEVAQVSATMRATTTRRRRKTPPPKMALPSAPLPRSVVERSEEEGMVSPFVRRDALQRTPPEKTARPEASCRAEAMNVQSISLQQVKDVDSKSDEDISEVAVAMVADPLGAKQVLSSVSRSRGASTSSLHSLSSVAERKRDGIGTEEEKISLEKSSAFEMHGIKLRLDRALNDPNAKFSKAAAQKITAMFSEVSKLMMQLGCENAYLKGRLAERESGNRQPTLFSEVVKMKSKPKETPLISGIGKKTKTKPKKNHSVIVSSSKPELNTAEKVKKVLLEAIDPISNRIRIKNVKKTNSGKVLVETHSSGDLQKISSSQCLKNRGLTTALPTARRPRIIIYDIPKEMEVEEIKRAIFNQNPELFESIEYDVFAENCNFRFRVGKKDQSQANWVIEATPEIRNRLRSASRVYVGWVRCRILDFISVTRCFKCLDLGHIAKYCRAAEDTCSHCGLRGHRRDGCQNLSGPKACGLCRRRGREHDHAVDDKNCPSFKIAQDRYEQTIDYGQ